MQADIDETLEERNLGIEARMAEERARQALADSAAADSAAAGATGGS